ncbi:MAG: OmpH family outer membrane protein, partial [Alistipes sp.]
MKRFIKVTLALILVVSATELYAQKFARVNMQEIVSVMPEFKEMQTNLEAFGKDLQEQLEQIQVEFNNKLADFQKNQATMAESVRQFKQQELEQLQNRYAEFQRVAQNDYQNKSAELFEPVQKKAVEAVAKVAKEG